MKTSILCLFLFSSTIGYPIDSNRTKRGKNAEKREKEDKVESLNITEISRRSCNFGKHFVGSNLFDGKRKVCFSLEDVNLLIARRDFELMIPRDLPQDLLDDKTVGNIMRYFYYGLWLLRRIDDCQIRRTMEKAFYDTLGGFLGYYLVPVCKFSYYASKVELKTVRNVMALYQKCRSFLNTNGNGWRPPIKDPCAELTNVRVEPLKFTDESNESCEDEKTYCADLDMATASSGTEIVDDNMIVSLPKIEFEDPEGYLSNIWLPFARKRTYNLRSCKSAFIFVKFYRSVSNCYTQKGMDKKAFDHKFRQWIVENIKVHLGDEIFYPGLGGILNVYESLRACNKRSDGAANMKSDEKFKTENDNGDYATMVEENSCVFADEIESPNDKLRKRALNDAEMEFIRNFRYSMPLDPEEKRADDWIEAFDATTLDEFQRKKIIKTKCKPKCKKLRKRPENATATTEEDKSTLQADSVKCTTNASVINDTEISTTPLPLLPTLSEEDLVLLNATEPTTIAQDNVTIGLQLCSTKSPTEDMGKMSTTTLKPLKTTTSKAGKSTKPPKKQKPTKPPKADKAKKPDTEPMSAEDKRRIFMCLLSTLFLLLLILIIIAMILCCRKYGKEGMENFKLQIQQLKEKLFSKKGAAPATPAAPTSKKSTPAATPADKGSKGKSADKKAEKGAAKADKKAEKGAAEKPDKNAGKEKPDKKGAKGAKDAEKSPKKGEKPDKQAEKAAKEAEKAAKKAEKEAKKGTKPDKAAKEAEKAAKKAEKEAKKKAEPAPKVSLKARKEEKRAQKKSPRPVGGFVSKPTRQRQKRGGRSRSRSPAAK